MRLSIVFFLASAGLAACTQPTADGDPAAASSAASSDLTGERTLKTHAAANAGLFSDLREALGEPGSQTEAKVDNVLTVRAGVAVDALEHQLGSLDLDPSSDPPSPGLDLTFPAKLDTFGGFGDTGVQARAVFNAMSRAIQTTEQFKDAAGFPDGMEITRRSVNGRVVCRMIQPAVYANEKYSCVIRGVKSVSQRYR